MIRLLPILTTVIAFALIPFAGVAQQTGTLPAKVTTNTYNGSTLSSDITISCKKLDLNANGVMSGTCTYDNNAIETGFKDTTIDLDTAAGCDSGSLSWNKTDFSADTTGADITLSTNGSTYLLEATCPVDTGTAAKSTLTVGSKVENENGLFNYK